jgi:hypothetical protein
MQSALDSVNEDSEGKFDSLVNGIMGDGSNQASSAFDLINNNEDSAENGDQNAHYEVQKEHLEAINEAEAVAKAVQDDPGKEELMYCADLDETPSHIEQVFSAVLGDTYHGHVHGPDEYKLFTCFLLHALESFDENKMTLLWIEKVDGMKVFPKHPHQL